MGQESHTASRRPLLARPLAAALYAIATLIVAAAAFSAVLAAHADRARLETGGAEWIWYASGSRQPVPVRFFAGRDFVLPAAPATATARLFVDREHALFVNGSLVGRSVQEPGDPLRVYRLAPYLRAGINRIVIEASSPTGVGGILFSLDLDGFGRGALVSDGLWRVAPSEGGLAAGGGYRPLVWGRPPQPPWGYPRMPEPRESTP